MPSVNKDDPVSVSNGKCDDSLDSASYFTMMMIRPNIWANYPLSCPLLILLCHMCNCLIQLTRMQVLSYLEQQAQVVEITRLLFVGAIQMYTPVTSIRIRILRLLV